MTGERPDFRRFARPIHAIRRKLSLRSLKCLIVDDAQRLIAVDDVPLLIGPPRHAVPRGAVEFKAAPQIAHFADQHPVRQDAANRSESPRPAKPRRHAAFPHTASDFLEPDRLRQVGLEHEADCFRFLFMNGEPLLAVVGLNDAIAVGWRPTRPAAFLVPLHEPFTGTLGKHAAVVGSDDQLHAACEGVRPFGDTHDLDAVLFEILDEHVRLGRPAEPVVLVDVEPVDAAGFSFLHEAEQFRPAARRAAGFRLVDEVLEGLTRRPLAGLDLHGDARAFVLGMAGVAGIERVVLAAVAATPPVSTVPS